MQPPLRSLIAPYARLRPRRAKEAMGPAAHGAEATALASFGKHPTAASFPLTRGTQRAPHAPGVFDWPLPSAMPPPQMTTASDLAATL